MAYLGRKGASAALTSADIPDNSITAAKIVADTIAAGDIATGAVDTAELADDAVTGAKIENNPTIAGNLTVSGDLVPSTPLSHRNHLINGDFQVAQRGTSFVGGDNDDDTYNLDRWILLVNTNNAIDVTQSSEAPANQLYSIGLDVEEANHKFGIVQIVESKNCVGLYGNDVTLSFKAKVSATTKLDNVKCSILEWRSTADAVTSDVVSAWGVEGTNPTLATNWVSLNTPANLSVTTSWATYSVTVTGSSGSGCNNFAVFIWSDVTDTTLGDFLYITDCQLEQGSNATPFEHRSYGDELARCQRYYEIWGGMGGDVCDLMIPYNSNGAGSVGRNFKVAKRAAPTITDSNTGFSFVEPANASGQVSHAWSDSWGSAADPQQWYIGSNCSPATWATHDIIIMKWTSASKFYIDAEL